MLDNELPVVTVATFLVAVFRILDKTATIIRPDEATSRHAFSGQLVARVHPTMAVTYPQNTPGHLHTMAKQIMNSRITVDSRGPIGYLESAVHP